eukprot:1540359-Rhodomonas_salina.3
MEATQSRALALEHWHCGRTSDTPRQLPGWALGFSNSEARERIVTARRAASHEGRIMIDDAIRPSPSLERGVTQ